jgi:phospholipase D1/2
MSGREDPLAYGHYNDDEGGERGMGDSARGFLSDTVKKFKDNHGHQDQQSYNNNPGQYSGSGQGQQSYQSGSYDASDELMD